MYILRKGNRTPITVTKIQLTQLLRRYTNYVTCPSTAIVLLEDFGFSVDIIRGKDKQ